MWRTHLQVVIHAGIGVLVERLARVQMESSRQRILRRLVFLEGLDLVGHPQPAA